MDKKFISKQLRTQFYPLLKAQGFTQKADVFWQVDGEVIRIVDIQHFKKRHCFQINLGIHLISLGEYVMGCTGKGLEIEKMRDYDCAWRGSILSGLINDYDSDWSYTQSAQDAAQMVEFLVSEWDRQSQLFLEKWRNGLKISSKKQLWQSKNPYIQVKCVLYAMSLAQLVI